MFTSHKHSLHSRVRNDPVSILFNEPEDKFSAPVYFAAPLDPPIPVWYNPATLVVIRPESYSLEIG